MNLRRFRTSAVTATSLLPLLAVGALCAPQREETRRFGALIEERRREEVAAVERSYEALRTTRSFLGGVQDLALDAEGRVLVGGSERDDVWLGILRFSTDGRLDERFLREISRNFEDDSVVGGVRQILPLDDGRILVFGGFWKPRRPDRRRAGDPGGSAFVLLDESGRIQDEWVEEFRRQWPHDLGMTSSLFLGDAQIAHFLGRTEGDFHLYSLALEASPRITRTGSLPGRWVLEVCAISATDLLILSRGPRLELVRRDGSLIHDLTPDIERTSAQWDPDHEHRLYCGPEGNALALLSRIHYSPDPPIFPDSSGCPVGEGSTISRKRTHIVLVEHGAVVASQELSQQVRPVAATFSAQRGHWLVYGELHGDAASHSGLVSVIPRPPFAIPEQSLRLDRVSSMLELPDGRLLVAGRIPSDATREPAPERPPRIFQLAPGADEVVPF